MNTKLIALLLAAGITGTVSVRAAVPGPESNFDKNAIWARSAINATDASGLATRGLLYFDLTNDIGAVDRLTEAMNNARSTGELSGRELSDLHQILTVSEVLAGNPGAVELVRHWVLNNQSSPHRADMALLLGDLLLERGLLVDAKAVYSNINIDALSPNLRDDYLFHSAYTELAMGDYVAADETFHVEELLTSVKYGNAARFYSGYVKYINRDYKEALSIWNNVNTQTMPGRMANFYKAQIAYYDGNYAEALRMARTIVDDPAASDLFKAETNRIIGESLYQQGDKSAALPYLKKYVSAVDTPERSTLYVLGIAQYEEGNYDGAIESLTPVTTDESAMGQSAYLYIGQAKLKLSDYDGAIMAFNQALKLDADKAVTEEAYYNYAVANSRGGGVPFASSVKTFENFLKLYPDSRHANDVALYIVNSYITDGNYDEALKSINRVKNPSSSIKAAKQKVLYMLGAKRLATDKVDQAVMYLEEARSLGEYDSATNSEVALQLGEAYYRQGKYNQAADLFLEYTNSAPKSAANRPVALYDLGYTRMAQKEWSKAQTNFERIVENPGDLNNLTMADVQTRLGDVRYYQRNWSGAANAYNAAYNLYPEGGDYPLFQKAVMQGYNKKYSDKLATIEKLISSYPTSALLPDAYMEKAEAYIQLRKPEQANNVYQQLIEDYPETTQGRKAYLFLAAAEAGKGNMADAISTYEELIRLAPTSQEAQQANDALKRLHADQGTLDEYNDFVDDVKVVPTLAASEAENLAWTAAERSYLNGKGVAMLEKFINDYPNGTYTPRALGLLLENAEKNDNETESYRWASMLVDRFPDNNLTEDALIIKGDIDYGRGRGMDALHSWELLDQKASTPESHNIARLGIMRVARDTGDTERMRAMADALLKSTTLGVEDKTEAAFTRALALNIEGQTDAAIEAWKELASNTDDIYGAKSAIYAAEALNQAKKYNDSAEISMAFVKSGTPHTYWLARGFITLSDAYTGLGRNFDAKQYLQALKENYKGNEPDIWDMIEERLK